MKTTDLGLRRTALETLRATIDGQDDKISMVAASHVKSTCGLTKMFQTDQNSVDVLANSSAQLRLDFETSRARAGSSGGAASTAVASSLGVLV